MAFSPERLSTWIRSRAWAVQDDSTRHRGTYAALIDDAVTRRIGTDDLAHRLSDRGVIEFGHDLVVQLAIGAVRDQPALADRRVPGRACGPGRELEADVLVGEGGHRVGDDDRLPMALAIAKQDITGAAEDNRCRWRSI